MKINPANVKGTPFENVKFYFVLVTRYMATECRRLWLPPPG